MNPEQFEAIDKLVRSGIAAAKAELKSLGAGEYRYILESGIMFDVSRVRLQRYELHCEMSTLTTWGSRLGAPATVNLSSAFHRDKEAKRLRSLAARTQLKINCDWEMALEDLAGAIMAAERRGEPGKQLRDFPLPDRQADDIVIDGIRLPRRHPTIFYGDGGSVKSYLGLYFAGLMAANHSLRVGFFDWELAGEDHRDRLERMFGLKMPEIWYFHCTKPLIFELERLQREAARLKLDYAVFDSIAYACHGAPEDAEAANAYMRAVGQIGVGSLHLAHTNRSEQSDQKPFGSVFWHNGARATWFIKREDGDDGDKCVRLGMFNKKANLRGLQSPRGYRVVFDDFCTTFHQEEISAESSPELSKRLSLRQRLYGALKTGALTIEALAEDLEVIPSHIRTVLVRNKNLFTRLPDGRIALLEKSDE